MEYSNHLSLGTNQVEHRGVKLIISDSSSVASLLDSLDINNVEVIYIPAGFEHRPDLISNYFYGTVKNDWLIMMYNNITDPFQQLNVGERLLIPVI